MTYLSPTLEFSEEFFIIQVTVQNVDKMGPVWLSKNTVVMKTEQFGFQLESTAVAYFVLPASECAYLLGDLEITVRTNETSNYSVSFFLRDEVNSLQTVYVNPSYVYDVVTKAVFGIFCAISAVSAILVSLFCLRKRFVRFHSVRERLLDYGNDVVVEEVQIVRLGE